MKKNYWSISFILVSIALVVGYFLWANRHQPSAAEKQAKTNKLNECLKDQASIPKRLRTSGTYVDCNALYK